MKILPNRVFDELKNKYRQIGKKILNNPSENGPCRPGSILTTYNQEKEGYPMSGSTQRALELSRKGIFACPKYTRLFNDDEDEMRIY